MITIIKKQNQTKYVNVEEDVEYYLSDDGKKESRYATDIERYEESLTIKHIDIKGYVEYGGDSYGKFYYINDIIEAKKFRDCERLNISDLNKIPIRQWFCYHVEEWDNCCDTYSFYTIEDMIKELKENIVKLEEILKSE